MSCLNHVTCGYDEVAHRAVKLKLRSKILCVLTLLRRLYADYILLEVFYFCSCQFPVVILLFKGS